MRERRLKEIELLRKKYGHLKHGENLDWIIFEEFPLPSGWNRPKIRLLVIIPASYPTTPPDNFYVAVGLCTASGVIPSNYTEGQSHLGEQWGQFSFHVEGGHWRPSPNLLDGDNLLTFMLQVEKRLKEVN